jgi:putative DNA primase/helicase
VGKLVAVMSDARLSGRPDQQAVAENLLRISGEDQIEVDRKHRPSLALRLGVRIVMFSNEVPGIADASGAMASRFVILKMTESFLGREDPGLTTRLLAELPAIFLWAVEGWHRLNARGYFITPQSARDTAQELSDLGSPVTAFVRDACWQGAAAEVRVDSLYDAWCAWCIREGKVRAGDKSYFGRNLKAAMPSIRMRQLRGEEDRIRIYSGIGLRSGTGMHGQFLTA